MDSIRPFRAFVTLVDTGSFTATARELGVQQSTVSKWLSTLEEDFDCRLLDRTTRAQEPTEAGLRLYERARLVLDAYDETLVAMQSSAGRVRGRIRVSLPVVFGRLYVVPLVATFAKKHADVSLELHFSDHYSGLVGDGVDLAVRVGVPVDSSLTSHHLANSGRRLVASPGYLRTFGEPKSPAELAEHECLPHSAPGSPAVWTFRRRKKTERIYVQGRVRTDNSDAARSLARSGLGIGMLASWLVDGDIRAGRLVPILEEFSLPEAPIRALTPPGRMVPRHVRSFIDHLRGGLHKALEP